MEPNDVLKSLTPPPGGLGVLRKRVRQYHRAQLPLNLTLATLILVYVVLALFMVPSGWAGGPPDLREPSSDKPHLLLPIYDDEQVSIVRYVSHKSSRQIDDLKD